MCDDGVNDGRLRWLHARCNALGPFCGDGIVEPNNEGCDDGLNLAPTAAGCGPGCNVVPRCGDGRVDRLFGEKCDDSNTVSNDGCSAVCKLEIDVN